MHLIETRPLGATELVVSALGFGAAPIGFAEQRTAREVARRLRRLNPDHLDRVQLHSPPRRVLEDGEAVGALERARKAGKVRYIGVSADGPDAGFALDLGVFATLQVSVSILQQEPLE